MIIEDNSQVSGFVIKSLLTPPTTNNEHDKYRYQFMKERFKTILNKENISDEILTPVPEQWYSMSHWIILLSSLTNTTLFNIGVNVAKNAIRDEKILSFKDIIEEIDNNYKLNYRGENLGFLKMQSFNESKKEAYVLSKRPMPMSYDIGVLTGFAKLYGSKQTTVEIFDVALDKTITYHIKWS